MRLFQGPPRHLSIDPQVSLLHIHIFHSLRLIATEVGVKALGTGLKGTLETTQCVS